MLKKIRTLARAVFTAKKMLFVLVLGLVLLSSRVAFDSSYLKGEVTQRVRSWLVYVSAQLGIGSPMVSGGLQRGRVANGSSVVGSVSPASQQSDQFDKMKEKIELLRRDKQASWGIISNLRRKEKRLQREIESFLDT
ncbi:MAG: hypothetical protein OXT67_14100, partial [Zetaproteobacteria bacterium]|nr:hypothetical protein [Zetaproteobacteria bacterium]